MSVRKAADKSRASRDFDPGWLQAYLFDSISRNLCTKIQCTTCGALDFRRGLLVAMAAATGQPKRALDVKGARTIGNGLAHVSPDANMLSGVEEAVRLILFDVWTSIGDAAAEHEVEPLLQGTWCGTVLGRMKSHYAEREASQRAYAERIARAREQSNEKRRLKQEGVEARLAAKKERDRRWWQQHKKPG